MLTQAVENDFNVVHESPLSATEAIRDGVIG
ncbi:hypothetical protein PANA5342_2846 [Pantoea ananatis LMG 5342]|nr:hypothetical protein PANA5342_2846 [Pantoea ananatis LMG 5342]